MVEADNLVLEQLHGLRGENAKIMEWMQTVRSEMTAMRQHMAAHLKRLEAN
jgi:hypothetical protein